MTTPNKTAVARWASALTLGLPTPVADTFDTTKYFAKGALRIHYAAVFNGATATQIHAVSAFSWICCVQPEDLAPITTGAELVSLVEQHLTDQLKAAATPVAAPPPSIAAGVPSFGEETAPEEEETLPLADGGAE